MVGVERPYINALCRLTVMSQFAIDDTDDTLLIPLGVQFSWVTLIYVS